MGTSGRRTPPGARLAGPRGRPDRLRGSQKTSKSPFGFKWETENLSVRYAPWKLFNPALRTIAVSLSGSTDGRLIGSSREAGIGPGSEMGGISNVLRALRSRKAGRDDGLPSEYAVHSAQWS